MTCFSFFSVPFDKTTNFVRKEKFRFCFAYILLFIINKVYWVIFKASNYKPYILFKTTIIIHVCWARS